MDSSQTHNIGLHDIKNMLLGQGYISDESVCMSVFLSLELNKPLLIEGPAGVGKTKIAQCFWRWRYAVLSFIKYC